MPFSETFEAGWSTYRTTSSEGNWATTYGDILTISAEVNDAQLKHSRIDPQISGWDALGEIQDVDFLTRVTYDSVDVETAWALWVRLPDAGSWSVDNFGYCLEFRDAGSNDGTLNLYASGLDITPKASATVPNQDGTPYYVRFQAIEEGSGTRIRARVWAATAAEPAAWDIDTLLTGPGHYPSAGLVGFSQAGAQSFGATGSVLSATYELSYAQAGPIGGDVVRASIREDVGAIITATDVTRSDVSASIEFHQGADLTVGSLLPVAETLAPTEVRHRIYPHEEQTRTGLKRYAGTTILSRMARTYPEAIFARVQDISALSGDLFDAGDGEGSIYVTPQKAIDYVLTQWADALDWFDFEAVPDLRLKAPSPTQAGFAMPTEYSNDATLGRLPCPVLQFPQNDDDERNMKAILEELLSPFPGTIYRQNSSGRLEIVPTYGPDADETPVVTLTDSDVISVTEGEGDTRTIANAAIVESQPYTRQEDIGAMADAWFQVAAFGMDEADWYTTGTGTAIGGGRDGLKPTPVTRIWPVDSERIPDGDTILLTDSGGTQMVTADWKTPRNGNSGTFSDAEVTLTDIPKDGTAVEAVVISGFAGVGFTVNARWVTAREGGPGIKLWVTDVELRTMVLNGYDDWVIRVNLADATTAWELGSTTITGEFGFDGADTLPGADGGNALEQSRGRFERVVDRTSSTGYGLVEPSVLVDVARAHVMETITPQLIREVSLAPWRAYPVTFDHIGRLVQLPSGEEGIVIGRAYEASFGSIESPGSISCSLRVQVRNATGVGAIDVDTDYLLLDDGTHFTLDDGTTAEAG